jgi:phage terminase large subunit-like protein
VALLDIGGVKIDPRQQLTELDRAEYEESLYAFLKAAWPHLDPAQWRDGWPMEAVAEHLEAVVDGQIRRLIINIPPRTSKTSLCSVAFPAWTWAQRISSPTSGPGVRFMYASYGEGLSLDHSVYCRRLIKSEWYQKLWGDRYFLLSDEDTKHKFANNKMGERQITSIDARVTGRGGQIIVIDDPNATNEAESEAKIQTVTDWWDQTMNSRLNDRETGAFIIIQQRVAEGDLTGHILENHSDGWDHLVLPMRYEPDRSLVTSIGWKDPRTVEGELLWPERFSEHTVKALEREAGPWTFAGQYQQRPEPKGGGIIKKAWWNLWGDGVNPLAPLAYPPMSFILASLDTAFTERTENDPSAMTVWGVFLHNTQDQPTRSQERSGFADQILREDEIAEMVARGHYPEETPRVMLMTAWREWLEFHNLVEKVVKTCRDMKVDHLLIEAKASGISVAQEIRRLYQHESFGVQLIDPKSMDKVARLHSVVPLFAPEMKQQRINGQLVEVIARPGIIFSPDRAWAQMVMDEMGAFPKGRRDDLTDTSSMALRWLRDVGMLTLPPERLAEIEDSKRFENTRHPVPLYPG